MDKFSDIATTCFNIAAASSLQTYLSHVEDLKLTVLVGRNAHCMVALA